MSIYEVTKSERLAFAALRDQPTRARAKEKRTVRASCRAGAFDLDFEWEEAAAVVRKPEAHSGRWRQQIEREIDWEAAPTVEAWLL